MKKTILSKTLLFLTALTFTFSSYGQLRIDPSNNVLVGQHWGQNAYKEFDVRGEMFVSHSPRNGVPGWGYVGAWFTNHSYQEVEVPFTGQFLNRNGEITIGLVTQAHLSGECILTRYTPMDFC